MPHSALLHPSLRAPLAHRRAPHRQHQQQPRTCASSASGSNGMEGAQQPQQQPTTSGAVHQPVARAFATKLVHSEDYIDDPYGATMPPIYQVW